MILSLENLGKERNNFDDLIHGWIWLKQQLFIE